MTEAVAFARLLHLVYRCAIEPELWPHALEAAAAYLRSASAFLEWRGEAGAVALFEHGGDQKYLRRYLDAARSEPARLTAADGIGRVQTRRLVDFSGKGLQEPSHPGFSFLRPIGYRDLIAVEVLREGATQARFSIARSAVQRHFDEADRYAIERIAPHVARAMAIANALELKAVDAGRLDQVLDVLPTPIAVTDHEAAPLFINAAARRLLHSESVLCIRDGRLAPCGADPARGWAQAFAKPAPPISSGSAPCTSVALSRGSADQAVAHILALSEPEERGGAWGRGRKAVFLVSPSQRLQTLPALFGSLHRLSASELRLVGELASDGSLEAVAERLGISMNTARTHLKRIFHKTGTSRQAELVRRYLSCRHDLPDGPLNED